MRSEREMGPEDSEPCRHGMSLGFIHSAVESYYGVMHSNEMVVCMFKEMNDSGCFMKNSWEKSEKAKRPILRLLENSGRGDQAFF